MEDEEWEDVLLCSYLTSPDKLGPKHFSDAQFNAFVQKQDWMLKSESEKYHLVFDIVKPPTEHPLYGMLAKAIKAGSDRRTESTGIRCAGKTRRKGFTAVVTWGNTVVHVGLDGRTDVLQDPLAPSNPVQYAAEQFGYLFLFRDYQPPIAYLEGKVFRRFVTTYKHFTCRGVNATLSAIYFTKSVSYDIVKIDRKLTETVVPGTEGTSDFVVLKDERLFWITKSFKACCGDKQKALVDHLQHTKRNSGNVLTAVLSNGNVLASFEAEELIIISPELEIIDSVANKYEKTGSYHMRISRRLRYDLDVAFLHVMQAIVGVAVRRNKIHLLKLIDMRHVVYSMSHIMDCWAICGEDWFTICKLNL